MIKILRKAAVALTSILDLANGQNTYALETGNKGSTRLELQSDYFHKESAAHLERSGLCEGQIVYDIGCGTGKMTHHIASIVGLTGQVYGIDSSFAQLELAKKKFSTLSSGAITFIQADVQDNALPCPQKADLVYCRFLLMHLKDPRKALSAMIKLLKPEGKLVLQECVTSTCHLSDYDPQLDKLFSAIIRLGEKLGLNYDMGEALAPLAESLGIQNIDQQEYQYELAPPFAQQFLTLTHEEWVKKSLDHNVITPEQYRILGEKIKNLNRSFFISKQVYVTGNI